MFYWGFHGPTETSPLILYLAGGPGTSSLIQLFMEMGPYEIDPNDLAMIPRPYSWSKFAHIVFIDSPVSGVGFSYASYNVTLESQAAENLVTFYQGLLQAQPQLSKSEAVYLIGESYGAKWVVRFATLLQKIEPKLKGISYGNGWISPRLQYQSYPLFADQHNLIPKDVYEKTVAFVNACNTYSFPSVQATQQCDRILNTLLMYWMKYRPDLNPMNIYGPCPLLGNPMCYNFTTLNDFLALPYVLKELNIPKDHSWNPQSNTVAESFTLDKSLDDVPKLASLLDLGIRVLVFTGNGDVICNVMGVRSYMYNMTWTYSEEFVHSPFLPLRYSNGTIYGQEKKVHGLSMVEINGAGHMAAYDRPEAVFERISSFVHPL